MRYYDEINKRLLYFKKKVDGKELWDNHWLKTLNEDRKLVYSFKPKSLVCKITSKFLTPRDGPILEGGCGLGYNVYYLSKLNYKIIGVDNANETIELIKKRSPELNFQFGDVRKLSYQKDYFAGYWSLGVIEHFFEGFSQIALEMKRVIKPNGFLFLTFPYMSPFRKLKVKFHFYKIFNKAFYEKFKKPKNFYQFILNKENIVEIFEKIGFIHKYTSKEGGIKGFKDEIFFLKFFLKRFFQLLYKANKPKIIKKIKRLIDKVFSKFTAHTIVLVFQKA